MKNKLVFCIVLILTIFVSGCINSPLDNINEIMPEINDQIVKGDEYYNDAITALNSKNYAEADTKANSASNEFRKAKDNVLETNKYYEGLNETIYIEYLNLLQDEINLKYNASSNLLLASKSFNNNDITNGNNYAQIANSKMNEAINIQNERNQIVINNPELFKEFFHF
ncbi:hypothetical protein LJC03_02640 [Methanobrevibacter sp. OttesenSCG-928-I08]|nr:hypothetical protein [Methanobrevibacter sp. OttesenSCG-928-I08]